MQLLGILERLVIMRATASAKYLSTSASLGSTAIIVKFSLQAGQKGRNRFTLGIAITSSSV
jgi:hypothetical protein